MNVKSLRFLASVTALALLAACSSQKEPATRAIAALESGVAEVRADGERFASEQLAAVQEGVANLKDSLARKDYKTVVANVPGVQKQISDLRDTVAVRRQEFETASAKAVESWNGYAAEMPGYLDALQKRLDATAKRAKSKEITGDALLLDTIRNLWADAGNLFSIGKPVEAVARAEEARGKAQELAQKLGAKLS